MQFEGRIVGGARIDLDTRKMEFTLQSDEEIGAEWDNLRKLDRLTVLIKPFKKKRSLDANAYYWQLISKLSARMRLSNACMHNFMLRRYGYPETIEGKLVFLVLPDSEEGTRKADEAEEYHIKPTSEVTQGGDGMMYRTYLMMRGSSTYNTEEMSHLINGLVSECEEQQIETLPPAELDRMMSMYDANWRKRHEESI